jgi:hypothetical protein
MFGSQVIDVAIGMIFVFLLLSLICSAANEVIESKLKNRAKDLEKGIRNLLGDQGLVAKLYDHQLISGLFTDDKHKPSYIPSRTFMLALFNTVFPDGGATSPPSENVLDNYRQIVENLPETDPAVPIKQALLALIDDAEGDLDKFKKNVEDWYDAAMDRVSGWYKRRAHAIILVLGLLAAVCLNADTGYIAQRLMADPGTRNALVSAAQTYQKEAGTQQPPASAQESLKTDIKELKGLGLPLGWSNETNDDHLRWPGLNPTRTGWATDWKNQIRFHWLGWILTALAISLGAPFWFDMLNKIIVVRSTVKPQEKSPDEPSKD